MTKDLGLSFGKTMKKEEATGLTAAAVLPVRHWPQVRHPW